MAAEDYESGRARLDRLIEQEAPGEGRGRNEATTRIQLIDELIFGVFGWRRSQAASEVRFDGKYTDYEMGTPAVRLILEAKREGTYFELPSGVTSGVMSLSTLRDGSSQIDDAVRQVLSYCQERGVPLAAVSNGHQLVAFLASRSDGVPPLEGRALVFDSLESIKQEFQLAWDSLSQAGTDALRLQSSLGKSEGLTPPEKLSARIPNYPGYWSRNRIQSELKILGELVLEDILEAPELEEEFLASCYMASGTLSQYALVSKEILEARYTALDSDAGEAAQVPARRKGSVSEDLQIDVSAASLGRRPLILLGDVGVGKSIFIRHFRRIDARELMEQSVVLYVNFGGEPALADDLNSYVADRFAEQLRDVYDIDIASNKFVRNVYQHDLKAFSNGVYGPLRQTDPGEYQKKEIRLLERKIEDRDGHLKASLRYVAKTQKRQVVVFLDNIDQRSLPFQEEVFLIGQSLAQTWPATVFLSLRPETFFRSRSSGSLTAYQPRVFTIEPPEVGNVIRKRLRYCKRLVEDSGLRAQVMPDALDQQASQLAKYLDILEKSFGHVPELVELVENLGGGNVRAVLGYVNSFVGSGHVNTQKILDIEKKSGSYTVPLHEFVRAIIYGDYRYYDPAASPIANLFEISTPDPREHFLLPILLAHIERTGIVGQQEGFVEIRSIMDFSQGLGYTPAQAEFALRHAVDRRLIQQAPTLDEFSERRYRITTVGAYTYKRLIGTFVYLDAIVVDTPIVHAGSAQQIDDCQDIKDRVTRCRHFAGYLDSCWEAVGETGTGFDWTSTRAPLQKDYERIERTLSKRRLF